MDGTLMTVGLLAALVGALTALSLAGDAPPPPQEEPPGYTDTPKLPDSRWRIHDRDRPRPPIIDPGWPGRPPSDAILLFDGEDLSQWVGRRGDAAWRIEDGYMEVNGTGDILTREAFGDCQLHLEWCTPAEVRGQSQGRGNSGVYFMGRYEVQILDSYDNATYADGQAAAIYSQKPPMVNACRSPGTWQSYDIIFIAPRFEDRELRSPARVTVFHNGVCVHHAQEILGSTGHRKFPNYRPHGPKAPLRLQDHGNPVRYRNVWIRPLAPYEGYDG
jgi:hypothetical protein